MLLACVLHPFQETSLPSTVIQAVFHIFLPFQENSSKGGDIEILRSAEVISGYWEESMNSMSGGLEQLWKKLQVPAGQAKQCISYDGNDVPEREVNTAR